jgi:hypothetical protein
MTQENSTPQGSLCFSALSHAPSTCALSCYRLARDTCSLMSSQWGGRSGIFGNSHNHMSYVRLSRWASGWLKRERRYLT